MPIDDLQLEQIIVSGHGQANFDILNNASLARNHGLFWQSLFPGYHAIAFRLKPRFNATASPEERGRFVLRQDKECTTPT